ncbi:MAG: LysR family transcriptional regulator [Tabrizicola sp.]|nr:LysR family transcriptional regulator [Tabrizicola sp.]
MIDWHNFPPLSALKAFLAFVGTETLEQAGAQIGVTHAAISQQIRALEDHLGLTLVARGNRRLALTDDGRKLATALQTGFGAIDSALRELTAAEAARPIRVSAAPALASNWLLPRLPAFRGRHPEIDLVVEASNDLRVIGQHVDIGLRFGQGRWPGVESRLIFRTPVLVVGAPSLVRDLAHGDLAALAGLPWLQELDTSEVADFFARHTLASDARPGLTSLPGNLMIDAARRGQGLALIAAAFVREDLAAGTLREVFRDTVTEGYYLVLPTGPQRPAIQTFQTWILHQAAKG